MNFGKKKSPQTGLPVEDFFVRYKFGYFVLFLRRHCRGTSISSFYHCINILSRENLSCPSMAWACFSMADFTMAFIKMTTSVMHTVKDIQQT